MARYRGPKAKISRRFGENIFGGRCKALERKNYAPGEHGKRRKTHSEYGKQMREKIKAQYIYGVLDGYLRRLLKKASRRRGVTGHILLQMLESRLDTVTRRLGLAPTQAAARQLVSHKKIKVNGRVVNIASYQVAPGDVITLTEKGKKMQAVQESLSQNKQKYNWLTWDQEVQAGKFMDYPKREDIPEKIVEQKIVEFCSK